MNTKFADILWRLFDNNHKVLPAWVGKIKNSERLELMKYINDSLIPNYTAFLYPEYKTAKK